MYSSQQRGTRDYTYPVPAQMPDSLDHSACLLLSMTCYRESWLVALILSSELGFSVIICPLQTIVKAKYPLLLVLSLLAGSLLQRRDPEKTICSLEKCLTRRDGTCYYVQDRKRSWTHPCHGSCCAHSSVDRAMVF